MLSNAQQLGKIYMEQYRNKGRETKLCLNLQDLSKKETDVQPGLPLGIFYFLGPQRPTKTFFTSKFKFLKFYDN